MRNTVQSRLNRVVLVGYYPVALLGGESILGSISIRSINERRAGMDVSGLGSVGGIGSTRSVAPSQKDLAAANANSVEGNPTGAVSTPKDELDISAAGQLADRVDETAEMRADRLARIKASIDEGTYDTDEKLEAALSRMFGSLGIEFDEE